MNQYLKTNHSQKKINLAYVLKQNPGNARSRIQLVRTDGNEMYELITILCETPLFMYAI